MKKALLIVVLLGTMLTATTYFVAIAAPMALFGKGIKGSGNIITHTIDAPDFNGIETSRAVKVVITDKVSDKIKIEADDNIMEYVVAKVKNGELVITIDNSIKSIKNMNVTVTVPANGKIRTLEASSAATIKSDVLLVANKFELDASSASKINVAVKSTSCGIETSSAAKIVAQLETSSCSIDTSSASSVTLSGSAKSCNIDMSSASKLSADDFVITNARIDTSSAASAVINCTGELHASASSGSSVRYSGNPDTTINKSSGGSVNRK